MKTIEAESLNGLERWWSHAGLEVRKIDLRVQKWIISLQWLDEDDNGSTGFRPLGALIRFYQEWKKKKTKSEKGAKTGRNAYCKTEPLAVCEIDNLSDLGLVFSLVIAGRGRVFLLSREFCEEVAQSLQNEGEGKRLNDQI